MKDFIQQVIAAVEAAGIDYMIGGAVATWAWGEPRATLDLDVVLDIPLEFAGKLSDELGKRGMLVPADIILDNILETRADIPINAIHLYSGYKADLYPLRPGDELRAQLLSGEKWSTLVSRSESCVYTPRRDLIIYKLWYYSLSRERSTCAISPVSWNPLGENLDYETIEHWANAKGLQRPMERIIG